ncbi:MAG TPA: anhydro-N-acetylmuramic acid kinase [Acidimicrobiales bacterium]|jgi:anhydro-N-acetylmuramic acid kinase|nr:anhydro-N-acetylmuramic acid kinase [Acidimicrobiales bacterium]
MKVIGMISGTSFDAVEAVAMNLSLSGGVVRASLLGHVSVPYEASLRTRIADILPPHATTIDEVCRLDTLIGQSFAEVAAELGDTYFDGATDVICSHGQTVFHWVDGAHALGTLQIGQGAWIAERTGATIVEDVRSRDVAAGGHGAPLASLLDVLLLGKNPPNVRGSLNLGGISNVTIVGPTSEPIAFDIGSANALMDAAVTWLTNGEETFDRDGERAARGTVDAALLEDLLGDPYYDVPAPKSTGKEYFHETYLREHIGSRTIATDDLLATLAELTVETVARAVEAYGVTELFAAGGGTRNPIVMAGLRRRLPNVALSLIDDFGVPEDAKEACLFAIIGFLSVHGLASTVPSATGARHESVLGAIIPGRQAMASLPASDAPTLVTFVEAVAT